VGVFVAMGVGVSEGASGVIVSVAVGTRPSSAGLKGEGVVDGGISTVGVGGTVEDILQDEIQNPKQSIRKNDFIRVDIRSLLHALDNAFDMM